ncbi:glycosyltransferase [Neobacillus sp. LXY-1]|uniref:glycosyltransferase n=1 Tax=Neobacillus sp. LXY-1 TaxID=3379133 RepID=UPI003EDFB6E8
MKVLYLCSSHPPYDKRVYYKISNALVKGGYDVININPNAKKEVSKDKIIIDGFTRKKGLLNRVLSLKNLYKVGKEYNPDVILAPEPDSIVIAYILKLLKKDIKVIFDCHEWYEIHFKEKINNKIIASILNNFIGALLKFISKRIDAVFCVNNTMRRKYEKYNKNSFSIPNTMSMGVKDSLCELQRDNNSFAFIGNFSDKRQESILIEAAKVLKRENSNAKIHIVGGFPDDETYEGKFNEYTLLIKENDIQGNIEIIPWMSKDNVNNFLKKSIAGITRFDSYLYGDYHCLPNKLFDYMAANLAIITCELNEETSSIVKESECGIAVLEESGDALAKGIIYMMNNKEKTIQMGNNAYETIKGKYNWEKYEKELCTILKDI